MNNKGINAEELAIKAQAAAYEQIQLTREYYENNIVNCNWGNSAKHWMVYSKKVAKTKKLLKEYDKANKIYMRFS